MVYAFDFDGTASDVDLHNFIITLKKNGNEVWIVTMRSENDFNEKFMSTILSKLCISKFNVIFSSNKPKWELLKGINANVYVDNISDEFEVIKRHTNTIPLLWS